MNFKASFIKNLFFYDNSFVMIDEEDGGDVEAEEVLELDDDTFELKTNS